MRTVPAFKQRVLVVDDNQDAATSLALLLQAYGYVARGIHDPREVAKIAAEFCPHAIICDLQMPHIDGFELGRRISAAQADVALIAMSAQCSERARTHAAACGFRVHLCKPSHIGEVLAEQADRQ